VPYSSFPQFQRLMAEDSAQVVDVSLLQVTLPSIPGLVERCLAPIQVRASVTPHNDAHGAFMTLPPYI